MLHQTPAQIDRFQIVDVLGRGAQGTVFLARDPSSDSHVALKLLSPMNSSGIARSRFLREFAAISRLSHPSIVAVYEQGSWDALPYFTMEYVAGTNVARYAEMLKRDVSAICRVMASVADALAYTHLKGVIHRDLKPANILIDRSGTPKLSDFGMAKPLHSSVDLTQTTSIVGTMNYISPEILRNDQIDPRSDLYSFGIILYELLTGTVPFQSDSMIHIVMLHLSATPPFLSSRIVDCPPELDTLVSALLSKDPWNRPATAELVAESLNRIADDLERSTSPDPTPALVQGPPLVARFIGRESAVTALLSSIPDDGVLPFSIRLVRSNSGLGKTRLIQEALMRIPRRDVRIIRLPSVPIGALPFEAIEDLFAVMVDAIKKSSELHESLQDLLPDLSLISPHFARISPESCIAIDPSDTQTRINLDQKYRRLARIFSILTQKTLWVIVIEDIQNSDAASLNLIDAILIRSEIENVQAVVWGSVREEDVINSSAFSEISAKWVSRKHVETIELFPMNYHESCKLVASMIHQSAQSPDTARIVSCGHGCPMILVETVRSHAIRGQLVPLGDHWELTDSSSSFETLIPASIRDILRNRIDNLLPETLDTLSWAAVLDPDIDFEILKFTDQVSEESILNRLNRLISHRFLEVFQNDGKERYRFCHVQLRNLLLEMIGDREVQNRHREIAMILQTMAEGTIPSYRVARHLDAGGVWIDAIKFWGKACCESSAEKQSLKVIEFANRAESIFEIHGTELNRAAQRLRMVYMPCYLNALCQRSEYLKFIAFFSSNRELLQAHLSTNEFRFLHFRLIMSYYSTGSFEKGDTELLALISPLPPNLAQDIRCRANISRALGRSDPRATFKALMNQRRFLKASGNTDGFIHRRFMVAHSCINMGRFFIAENLLQLEYQRAVEDKNPENQSATLNGLGALYLHKGEPENAVNYLRKALDIHRKLGEDYWISCDLHDLGLIELAENRYREAQPLLEESLEFSLIRGLSRESSIAVRNLSELYLYLNKYDSLIQMVDRLAATFTPLPMVETTLDTLEMQANALCISGQIDRASTATRFLIRMLSKFLPQKKQTCFRVLLSWASILWEKQHIRAAEALHRFVINHPQSIDTRIQWLSTILRLNWFLTQKNDDEISLLLHSMIDFDISQLNLRIRECLSRLQQLAAAFKDRNPDAMPPIEAVIREDGAFREFSAFYFGVVEWIADWFKDPTLARIAREERIRCRELIAASLSEEMRMDYLACRAYIPEW